MAYKVVFAPTAIARLEDIVRYIAASFKFFLQSSQFLNFSFSPIYLFAASAFLPARSARVLLLPFLIFNSKRTSDLSPVPLSSSHLVPLSAFACARTSAPAI